jgi:hypothetical protein
LESTLFIFAEFELSDLLAKFCGDVLGLTPGKTSVLLVVLLSGVRESALAIATGSCPKIIALGRIRTASRLTSLVATVDGPTPSFDIVNEPSVVVGLLATSGITDFGSTGLTGAFSRVAAGAGTGAGTVVGATFGTGAVGALGDALLLATGGAGVATDLSLNRKVAGASVDSTLGRVT